MMHLTRHSTTNTSKHRKKKWASADQKRISQELETSWQQIQESWRKLSKPVPAKISQAQAPKPYRRETQNIPSLQSTHVGAVSSKPNQKYTGDKIVGIGTLHKSNSVPVFSNEEAADISRMRRG